MSVHTEHARAVIRKKLRGTVESKGRFSGEANRRRRVNASNPDFNVGSGAGRKVIKPPVKVPITQPRQQPAPITKTTTTVKEKDDTIGGIFTKLRDKKILLDNASRR